MTDERGDVSKEDFVKIALDNKLLDFGNVMSGADPIKNVQKKSSTNKYSNYSTGQEMPSGKVNQSKYLTNQRTEIFEMLNFIES